MKYRVYFPLTRDMSRVDYVITPTNMQTKEEQALWYYNNSRDHDGLPPLRKLPNGTRFEREEQ